jgi:hypothetical protein
MHSITNTPDTRGGRELDAYALVVERDASSHAEKQLRALQAKVGDRKVRTVTGEEADQRWLRGIAGLTAHS